MGIRVICFIVLSGIIILSLNLSGVSSVFAEQCPKNTLPTLQTTDVKSTNPTWKTRFISDQTQKIFFAADLPSHYFVHHLMIKVYSPHGIPYVILNQQHDRNFVDSISCGIRNWQSMSVAGTPIVVSNNLHGTWTAKLYVDSRLAATSTFEIISQNIITPTAHVQTHDPVWRIV